MGILDQAKEIQSLKKKISELESKIQNKGGSFAAFGRSYSKVGSSDSDFLIRTKGQVKIQWGSKFIDLIKDGKINVDSKFIYKESKVGVKDGIYVVGEGDESQVILKIGDTELSLKEKIGTAEGIHKLLPKGSIIMFGGASADIPDGWAICDGQNGTPNLVGKFIKAGSTSGEEGGEEEIKLTSENMPQHTHTFVGGTFQTSIAGEHTHTVSYKSGDLGDNANNRNNIIGDQTTTTSSAGAHSHTIDMSSAQLSQEGQGTPLKWEPKYYSLIYIMKII